MRVNKFSRELEAAERDLHEGKSMEALKAFEFLAGKKVIEAIEWLVLIYSDKEYGVVNFKKSIFYADLAIDEFDSDIAKLVKANIFYFGDGVEIDYLMSFSLYKRLPDLKFSQREHSLAVMYLIRVPVDLNMEKAIFHSMNSYKLGNVGALLLLSQIYKLNNNFIKSIFYKIRFVVEHSWFVLNKENLRKDSIKHSLL